MSLSSVRIAKEEVVRMCNVAKFSDVDDRVDTGPRKVLETTLRQRPISTYFPKRISRREYPNQPTSPAVFSMIDFNGHIPFMARLWGFVLFRTPNKRKPGGYHEIHRSRPQIVALIDAKGEAYLKSCKSRARGTLGAQLNPDRKFRGCGEIRVAVVVGRRK